MKLSNISLKTPTPEEFQYVANFSFENFVTETARSSGQSLSELKNKLGGPPSKPGPHDIWYVVLLELKQIGFIWIKMNPESKTAFGYDIYLDPKYRSQGVGRQVMQLCGQELKNKNLKSVSICVFHHNEIARALYSSLGFREIKFDEERKQYTLLLDLKDKEPT